METQDLPCTYLAGYDCCALCLLSPVLSIRKVCSSRYRRRLSTYLGPALWSLAWDSAKLISPAHCPLVIFCCHLQFFLAVVKERFGFNQLFAIIARHPQLACVLPQAPLAHCLKLPLRQEHCPSLQKDVSFFSDTESCQAHAFLYSCIC